MTDRNQFGEGKTTEQATACEVCEAMLPDAVDGTLTEAEQRVFDRHMAGCVTCSQELEEAQRGAAWLGMLKQHVPEPSPLLLERILSQTIGQQASAAETMVTLAAEKRAAALRAAAMEPVLTPALPAAESRPVVAGPTKPSRWKALSGSFSLGWMKPLLHPRMAMTAAMAFFSIALTLNLTGVRLGQLSTASLRPSNVRRVVADRSAAAVRSFQNMRVVYQAETQVNDLRNNWQAAEETAQPRESRPKPGPKPAKPQSKRENPQGSSQLNFEPADPRGAGMTKQGV